MCDWAQGWLETIQKATQFISVCVLLWDLPGSDSQRVTVYLLYFSLTAPTLAIS